VLPWLCGCPATEDGSQVAARLRHRISAHTSKFPTVLEIPDKGAKYEPLQDPLMARVMQLSGSSASGGE
jgi:hypothetical protein